MNLKKNAFSYLMWFLYSVAVCVGLLGILGMIGSGAGYSVAVGFGVCFLWLLLSGLIVLFIHKLLMKTGSAKTAGWPALVAESLIVVILFAVGIALRVSGMSKVGEDAAYYELARVTEGGRIPQVVHGIVYVYLQLLHLIYLIFGNKFLAGIWLQVLLQAIAGLFLYFAARRAAGVIPAVTALAFVMISPQMIREALLLSPKLMFLAIYAIALLLCVTAAGKQKRVWCLPVGALIAAVCYLDIMGVTLLFFTVAGLFMANGEERVPFSRRLVNVLLCILGCALGFALFMALDALGSGKEITRVLSAWWELYQPVSFLVPVTVKEAGTAVDVLFLMLLLSVGIFSYWCSHYTEKQSVWVLTALSLALLECFGMTTAEMNGYVLLYILLAVLAGAGVSGLFAADTVGKALEQEKDVQASEVPVSEALVSGIPASETPAAVDPPPKVKLLDNPLPLPKKHTHKVLDYDLEPADGQDDFDLSTDEMDDYDI